MSSRSWRCSGGGWRRCTGWRGKGLKKPETDWKLPAAKRQKVLEVIGAGAREARRERSSRFAARRVLLAAAACLGLTVIVAALVFPIFFGARAWKSGGPEAAARMVERDAAGEVQFPESQMVELQAKKAELEGRRRHLADNFAVPVTPAAPPAELAESEESGEVVAYAGRVFSGEKPEALRMNANSVQGAGSAEPAESKPAGPSVVAKPRSAPKPEPKPGSPPRRPAVVTATPPMPDAPPADEPAPADASGPAHRQVELIDGTVTGSGLSIRRGAEWGGSRGGGSGGGRMAGDAVPDLGDVPLTGRLFSARDAKHAGDRGTAADSGSGAAEDGKKAVSKQQAAAAGTTKWSGAHQGDTTVVRGEIDALGLMTENRADQTGNGQVTDHGSMAVDGRMNRESGPDDGVVRHRRGPAKQGLDESDIAWSDDDGDDNAAVDPFAAADPAPALERPLSSMSRSKAKPGEAAAATADQHWDRPAQTGASDDYDRAAHDETRAKLLAEVDAEWKSAVGERGKAEEEIESLTERSTAPRDHYDWAEGGQLGAPAGEANKKAEKVVELYDGGNSNWGAWQGAAGGARTLDEEVGDRAPGEHSKAAVGPVAALEDGLAKSVESDESIQFGGGATLSAVVPESAQPESAVKRLSERLEREEERPPVEQEVASRSFEVGGDLGRRLSLLGASGRVDGAIEGEANGRVVAGYDPAAGEVLRGYGLTLPEQARFYYDTNGGSLTVKAPPGAMQQVEKFFNALPAGKGGGSGLDLLAQQELIRRQDEVRKADEALMKGRAAYASGDYEMAAREYRHAVEILPEVPMVEDRREEYLAHLADAEVALAQVPPSAESAIDLMAEMSAQEEPFSTFSLHVSDASFRVAAAAVARGERPDPETVRPEEFYNAFDYGDPAPTAGEPVACAIEQCAHPLLPSRNLVRVGVRTAAAGRGAGQPLRLTVLLDNSGSMEREDRRAAVESAMEQLASLLGPQDVVTVAGFARQPRLLCDRASGDGVQEKLKGLVANTPAEGGTNLEQALELAEELAMRQFDAGAQNRIVLLTDGAANLGNADPEELAKRVEELRQQGVSFDAAGFGTAGLNDRMLERLTRDGNGRYYVVDGPDDAGEQFARKLAGAFRPAAENVKVQVRFNPSRVGGYRLIGFEEHRLKKEDFRDDTVDAAEMASEEAGVAVYQVELLPDGEGEIGEVSVRFRDAAKGRMVERSWTMPHDESAPGFDRAPASMQVAGLAVLAADALRDGPLAPLTDWGELAPVTNQVRTEFAGSEKVGQLLNMVERLR
jgi:tetratricopeptide (TPR) repeat protein